MQRVAAIAATMGWSFTLSWVFAELPGSAGLSRIGGRGLEPSLLVRPDWDHPKDPGIAGRSRAGVYQSKCPRIRSEVRAGTGTGVFELDSSINIVGDTP